VRRNLETPRRGSRQGGVRTEKEERDRAEGKPGREGRREGRREPASASESRDPQSGGLDSPIRARPGERSRRSGSSCCSDSSFAPCPALLARTGRPALPADVARPPARLRAGPGAPAVCCLVVEVGTGYARRGCTRVDAVREAAAGGCGRPRSRSSAGAAAPGWTRYGRRRRARGGGGLRGRHRLRRPRRRALLHCESPSPRLASSNVVSRLRPCFRAPSTGSRSFARTVLSGRRASDLVLWLVSSLRLS